jgi:7-carboxy-7-deazaguanine synthase
LSYALRIAEIYKSTQGEGFLTGTDSVFVRASGCNLRCWFCDTPHASWQPAGVDLSIQEIMRQVAEFDVLHVVLTGGEPMLFAELIPLCEALRAIGAHVTIETAGTLYLPVVCDLMSISPKLSNSAPAAPEHPRWYRRHEDNRDAPAVVRQLIEEHAYQLKFVVETESDVDEVEQYVEAHPEIERARVMLMPQARSENEQQMIATWLIPRCAQLGLQYCPRKQIEWFGLTRGT